MMSALHLLGTTPTVQQADEYLQNDLGLSAETVGVSFEGRGIVMYSYENKASIDDHKSEEEAPVVLFLSLVHGNEPMGLLSLLETARFLTSQPGQAPFRALFVPFVNIDAYTLNLRHGQGCRRTNLRPTCDHLEDLSWVDDERISTCPWLTEDGVDLNRNHPIDWDFSDYDDILAPDIDENDDNDDDWDESIDDSPLHVCRHDYHGPSPWSESEARAVRDIVLANIPKAAISFHSRHHRMEDPLLIHPFTSARPFSEMNAKDAHRYRSWSEALNPDHFYVTGTALEAIHYTAGGSTIDWMHSANVTSFVIEVVPPCDSRWCPLIDAEVVYQIMERYGCAGRQLVDLVGTGEILPDSCANFSMSEYGKMYSESLLMGSQPDVNIDTASDSFGAGGTIAILVYFASIVVLGLFFIMRHLSTSSHGQFTIVQSRDDSELEDEGVEMNNMSVV